jgi:hypothetical protein
LLNEAFRYALLNVQIHEVLNGVTSTKTELWDDGFFYRAKFTVMRDLWLRKKCLPTTEEEAFQKPAYDLFQNNVDGAGMGFEPR